MHTHVTRNWETYHKYLHPNPTNVSPGSTPTQKRSGLVQQLGARLACTASYRRVWPIIGTANNPQSRTSAAGTREICIFELRRLGAGASRNTQVIRVAQGRSLATRLAQRGLLAVCLVQGVGNYAVSARFRRATITVAAPANASNTPAIASGVAPDAPVVASCGTVASGAVGPAT